MSRFWVYLDIHEGWQVMDAEQRDKVVSTHATEDGAREAIKAFESIALAPPPDQGESHE